MIDRQTDSRQTDRKTNRQTDNNNTIKVKPCILY